MDHWSNICQTGSQWANEPIKQSVNEWFFHNCPSETGLGALNTESHADLVAWTSLSAQLDGMLHDAASSVVTNDQYGDFMQGVHAWQFTNLKPLQQYKKHKHIYIGAYNYF